MSLHTHGEATATERIYHFRCKCGRAGVRRSRSRLVKLTCRDCSANVEWWKSAPLEAFTPPEISIELTAAQIDDVRADRDTWRSLSRKAIVGDEEIPHAATTAPAASTAPIATSTDAIRAAAAAERADEREQLTLGDVILGADSVSDPVSGV